MNRWISIRIQVATNNKTDMLILSRLLHQLNYSTMRVAYGGVTIDLYDFVSSMKTTIDICWRMRDNTTDGDLRFFFFASEDSQAETITERHNGKREAFPSLLTSSRSYFGRNRVRFTTNSK